MELVKKRLANLLSVKSIVTICLTVTFCVLTVQTKVTQEFNERMEAYLKALAQRAPADWSAEARAWAEETGLIAGDETGNKQYRGFLTREQFAVLLHRYARLTGEEKSE